MKSSAAARLVLLGVLWSCASAPPPPCIPEVRVVPGPPEEITVVGAKLPEPLPPVLESLDPELWPDQAMRDDPAGYEQALYSDLVELYGAFAEAARLIIHHNAAFDEAMAGAGLRLERLRAGQPDDG